MGSQAWKTVTAYHPDVERALSRAQREVFQRGEYGQTFALKKRCAGLGMTPPELPPEPFARSIAEARELADESGTSSILDVYSIGNEPAPGEAGPFPFDELRKILGTDQPTQAQVEANHRPLFDQISRGAAAYIICFEGRVPCAYVFMGWSFG